jgi:hypothetical protein
LYNNIKSVKFEIIVVDNNSSDGTAEYIEKKFPLVILIKNNFNNLFAGANNQGYEISRGEYILILNSDTIVFDESIDKMIRYYESNKELGAITCRLLNKNGTTQYCMHRRFPNYFRLIFSFIYKKWKNFRPRIVRDYLYLDNEFNKDFLIEQAAGVFILTKRSVIKELGGLFDEIRFPLFYNDVDFCYRLSKKSKKIICLCDYSIFHLKGQSTGKLNFLKGGEYYAPAALLYFKKNNKKFDFITLKISFLFLFLFLNVLGMIRFFEGKIILKKLIEDWAFLKKLFYI